MAKGPAKARETRVNIVISDALRGKCQPELPFRLLVMGDYTQKADSRPVAERKPVDVNKSNFDTVMQSMNLSLDLSVPDKVSGGGGDMPVSLKFGTLKDFRPESIAQQVPELRKRLEIRNALKAIRPKMTRKDLQGLLSAAVRDSSVQEQLLGKITKAGDAAGGGDGAPAGDATQPEKPA